MSKREAEETLTSTGSTTRQTRSKRFGYENQATTTASTTPQSRFGSKATPTTSTMPQSRFGSQRTTAASTTPQSRIGSQGTAAELETVTGASSYTSLVLPGSRSQPTGSLTVTGTQAATPSQRTQLQSLASAATAVSAVSGVAAAPARSPDQPIKARVLTETLSKHRCSLLLVRCAERVDRVFPDWLNRAFADDGTYQPYDLNFPQRIPVRPKGPLGFHNDPPITALGAKSAELLGRGLRHRRLRPVLILASPALRCVQTAVELSRALGGETAVVHLEPGLMEPMGWYPSLPAFLTPQLLAGCGYSVSLSYKPQVPMQRLADLAGKESTKAAAARIRWTLETVLERVERETPAGLVLVVGHAFTLDAGLRSLDADAAADLPAIGRGFLGLAYPYTAHLLLHQHLTQAGASAHAWALLGRRPKPLPALTTLHFTNTPLPLLIDSHYKATPV